MNPSVIRLSALLLGLFSLTGLYLAWLAIAVTMGFGGIFQIPLLICVALLAASPLLMARAPPARAWSLFLSVLRWFGLLPFIIGLHFLVPGIIDSAIVEGKTVYGGWSGLALTVLCLIALSWPEIRWALGLWHQRLQAHDNPKSARSDA
jgi:hypothetical protein